jgi:hypothetical protein
MLKRRTDSDLKLSINVLTTQVDNAEVLGGTLWTSTSERLHGCLDVASSFAVTVMIDSWQDASRLTDYKIIAIIVVSSLCLAIHRNDLWDSQA